MKPWVTKKITEYLGVEEMTLISFICKKLAEHMSAQETETQLQLVLEEEAKDFTIKMWRMLILSEKIAGVCGFDLAILTDAEISKRRLRYVMGPGK